MGQPPFELYEDDDHNNILAISSRDLEYIYYAIFYTIRMIPPIILGTYIYYAFL